MNNQKSYAVVRRFLDAARDAVPLGSEIDREYSATLDNLIEVTMRLEFEKSKAEVIPLYGIGRP